MSKTQQEASLSSQVNSVHRILWSYLFVLGAIHLLSLLAFVPWFFSWTGVVLWIVGQLVFGTLGVTLGFHRLLTHKSFKCSKWLEHFFATLGICCLEDTPARWVAIHRKHHQFSDEPPDPHTPIANFFWGHVGWIFTKTPENRSASFYEKYAKDILLDPYYMSMERNGKHILIYLAHAALYFLVGWAIGGVQFGASLLVWGVFLRTVTVWHVTWSVNSLTHLFGYRNYETTDQSRNNWLVGIIAAGEGWHNNHHADQRSASNRHKWWEFDATYVVILFLKVIGLAWDVVPPRNSGKLKTES